MSLPFFFLARRKHLLGILLLLSVGCSSHEDALTRLAPLEVRGDVESTKSSIITHTQGRIYFASEKESFWLMPHSKLHVSGSTLRLVKGELKKGPDVDAISTKKWIVIGATAPSTEAPLKDTSHLPSKSATASQETNVKLHQTLRLYKGQLRKCLIRDYKKNLGHLSQGLIYMDLEIHPRGHVTQASVLENENSALSHCLKGVMARARFSPSQKSQRVTVPISVEL